jgi:beta-lactamase class A
VSYLGNGDSTAGMAVVNNFCLNHGYTATSMGRLLLASNEFGDNYTSVSDCGHFLKEIYQNNTEEFPYAESMFSLLAAQTRRNKIPAQMPEDVHIANKTGELSNVENDAGIIYDSSNDLVIVFMSENLSGVGAAQSTIASLSRQIYDYYAQ